jgi:hypothetical protein
VKTPRLVAAYAAAILAAAAGGGGLTYVLAGDEAPPIPTPNRAVASPRPSPVYDETAYLAQVRRQAPNVGNEGDEFLLNLGLGLCESIAAHGPLTGVETPEGVGAQDVRVVIDAATGRLCPELRAQVADYLRSPA